MPEASSPQSVPTLPEALGWIDFRVDEMSGASVAKVQAVFVDCETDEPVWVIAKVGRIGGKSVAVPFLDCAAGAGHVWVPYSRDDIRDAPGIDPTKALTREQELQVCAHYGVHDGIGRARDVSERPEGAVTSRAASAAGA